MKWTDTEAIAIALVEQRTAALNEATKHLAEVMMNRSVKAALAGKNVESV